MSHGIVLTGGAGTRLLPLSKVTSKHMLNVNGKFIIDFPIETLKQLGCTDVTVLLGGEHYSQIVQYLGDGHQYEMNFNYVLQHQPQGIAQAINLCKKQVGDSNFTVILGDNIFEQVTPWNELDEAQVMLATHPNLNRFGVASLAAGKIVKIEEKPKQLDTNYINLAVTGCYRFTSQYFEYFKELKPSARQEYEITDIIDRYLKDDNLSYGIVNGLWSDAGTHESINYINYYYYLKSHGITQV